MMTLIQLFRSLRNWLDYPLRQRIRWQRRGLRLKNEPKDNLFASLPPDLGQTAGQMDEEFRLRYHLDTFKANSTRQNYRANLYYLEMLEKSFQLLDLPLPNPLRAVDIGVSDWFYAPALAAFLSRWKAQEKREIILEGYEADAYRVYNDLHSCYDYASAYIQGLENVHYIPDRFKPRPETYDLITLFFPFVFLKDHLEWGLPRRMHSPETLLKGAWQSLKPGGLMLIVNQGEEERLAQKDALERLGCVIAAQFEQKSLFFQYPIAHFVTITCR